jgi:hypothetical protein
MAHYPGDAFGFEHLVVKNAGWSTFSITDALKPPEGWRTDCAVLSTYSADLVVIVTSLLALAGYDLDGRKGSSIELVKTIEALRGRVRILAQAGRIPTPKLSCPMLKLLDRFLKTIDIDENLGSWHAKVALVRYRNIEDTKEQQWRVWLGSRNLTRALNWESGMSLTSRSDGRGQNVDGLATMGKALADFAALPTLEPGSLAEGLAKLTWEVPPGCEVKRIHLYGPKLHSGLPQVPPDIERMFVMSPFLDAHTVRSASKWGHSKTRRTLISTARELDRVLSEDGKILDGFDRLRVQPLPELPAEYVDTRDQEDHASVETAESEAVEVPGLHAKLLFAAKGGRRQLWLGSANAARRGWEGKNFEVVGELAIGRDIEDGIEDFIANCDVFKPSQIPTDMDEDEKALEKARKVLSRWLLRQQVIDDSLWIMATELPPVDDPALKLEVGLLGGSWKAWPLNVNSINVAGFVLRLRSDFVQLKVSRGDRVCSWVQVAPCDPPVDKQRDEAIVAEYLTTRAFLLWLRSLLSEEGNTFDGSDWDAAPPISPHSKVDGKRASEIEAMPTVEEILRSWARGPSSFAAADEKVRAYLAELERRTEDRGEKEDTELLKRFRRMWESLAVELR